VIPGRVAGLRACLRLLAACLLVGVLAGCDTLPTLAPDMARARGPAAVLHGTQGPLSVARSRAVLDDLARRAGPTDIFARHLAVEEAVTGSPLTTGNSVRLLQDGPQTYRAMLAAIAAARDHVHLETYILDDDEVGRQFAQALVERQRAGVQVLLIRDGAGTFSTPPAFFQKLTDAGIRVLEFNPLNPLKARKEWELNRRDHRKLLIVDGRTAFLGGINISSVYSGGSFKRGSPPRADGTPTWRDTDIQLEGPVVAELQKLFLAAWASQKGEAVPERAFFPTPVAVGPLVVRAIGSSPDEAFSQIYATLLSAIGSAERSVHITNAYFVPDPQLLAALEAAAARGVTVSLILPGQTDSWLVFHAGRAFYERLLRAGVRIHERRGAILHSKVALVDGVWATIGSTNLDWRSFLHNHELNAVVLGAEFGAQVQALFERDLSESEPILLPAWQRRSPALRLKEAFASAWAYWL
jgi:cardiolipin synthase A/B